MTTHPTKPVAVQDMNVRQLVETLWKMSRDSTLKGELRGHLASAAYELYRYADFDDDSMGGSETLETAILTKSYLLERHQKDK